MMPEPSTNPSATPAPVAVIDDRLSALRNLLRRCIAIEGAAWVFGFMFLAGLVQFGLDAAASGLRWSMRAGLLLVVLVIAGTVAWRRLIAPLRHRFGRSEMANLVERRYPQLRSVLISAVRFSRGEIGPPQANSPALVQSVMDSARRAVESVEFTAVVDRHRARRSSWAIVAVLVIVSLISTLAPTATALWLTRSVLLMNVPWPKETHLVVVDAEDGVLTRARGDDVVIEAYADGVQPREVEFFFETQLGDRGREMMVTVGSAGSYRYRYTFSSAQDDFEFHLAGGDDETAVHHVRLLDRPGVVTSELVITPPAYVRQESTTIGDGRRSVQVLLGTRLSFRVTLNKSVVKADLMKAAELIGAAGESDGVYEADVTIMESGSYHFALLDEVGLENRRPVRFAVRALKDEPPRVRLTLAGVGDMITPEAILPVELSLEDRYGLAEVSLQYNVLREEEVHGQIELPSFEPYTTNFLTTVQWPVSAAGVLSSDRLTLLAEASDSDDISGPNIAQSAEISLRVVTRDELLAELARKEQELRQSFERLVDAQEQVRGRLLTVRNQHQEAARTAELAAVLAPLERRQRNLTSSVNVVRQQFEQILTQLRINQLDTAEEMRRLDERIIVPLTALVRQELVIAADTIRQWSREGSLEASLRADHQQVQVLKSMRAVLAEMIQWEGYHEVVTMLRDIIRLQKDLSEESREMLLREAEDIFDD